MFLHQASEENFSRPLCVQQSQTLRRSPTEMPLDTQSAGFRVVCRYLQFPVAVSCGITHGMSLLAGSRAELHNSNLPEHNTTKLS
uniref:Uncharacterized protein n=1 Tax=Lutzomyia longipalpis TaxID=7200 RepID=A0A1B0CT78_LUTLO